MREVGQGQTRKTAAKLPFEHLVRPAGLALGERFTHAEDGREVGRQSCLDLEVGGLVGLAVELAALGDAR